MEEKKSRGGARPGAGRPKRDEELEIINLLDKHIDRDVVVLKLLEKIKQGDGKMITLYLNYVYGKPTQTINQTTTLSVNDVDISELISFKKPDSENE
jgi:hypothetical protein